MIRIKTIHIEAFRGIKDLDLDLGGENFGICGPNGTGKSGVVDAVEFCITGNITRLSGQGAGELSVKNHGPHVDQRTTPDKAKVSIRAVIPGLNKEVMISRAVNSPRSVTILPAGGAEEEVVKELAAHPEFALSRREIAKYIIAQPGKRSEYVQDLLRLDLIGKLRASLNTYANKCRREAEEDERARSRAEIDLKTALDLQTLDRTEVLEKANVQRRVLGYPELTELTPKTSFIAGATNEDSSPKKHAVDKNIALGDLSALATAGADLPNHLAPHREVARKALEQLKADQKAVTLARQHGLITAGLDLLSEDACPLCDEPWDAEELRAHLRQKLLSAEAIGEQLAAIETGIQALITALEGRIDAIVKLIDYGIVIAPDRPNVEIHTYAGSLAKTRDALTGFLDDHSRIEEALAAVGSSWWPIPLDVQAQLDDVKHAVESLSDRSDKEKAAGFLAVLQDRYERLLETTGNIKASRARSGTANKFYEYYVSVSNTILSDIYDAVAGDFTSFYRILNDDEDGFVGDLKAGDAKLKFEVDFYGKGKFPPGAYHSEGHQDGMGICLYLALMKHTLADKFTFAVLDDVLMSVDTAHRREVCRLLKSEFPNTQFILTTHDRIWLQYMKTEGLIRKGQFFSGWHVATGPRIWDDIDVWTEINAALDKDEVATAATLLRRYLEYISSVLADNLRAPVEYREDANYDLGDLMPPVFARWRDRIKKGIKTAAHWGHEGKQAELSTMLQIADSLIGDAKAEQKPINQCIHFNSWENYSNGEFQMIADAFKALLDHIRCSNSSCGGYPYLTPKKGPPELLRCSCQAININLRDT